MPVLSPQEGCVSEGKDVWDEQSSTGSAVL